MKRFLFFIKKEFLHIFRDTWTMVILLLLPVVMLILFGFAITTELKNANVAVLDLSKDETTRSLIDKLDASEYFSVIRTLHSTTEIETQFQRGDTTLVVVFSERFQENIQHGADSQVQLIADASDPNTASMVVNYATNILRQAQQGSFSASAEPFQIQANIKLLYNPQMKGAYNFVPGVMGMILMLICAMMTSISIAREKEKGTMELLLASPMRPIAIIFAKAIPYLMLSLVNLITILLFSYFLLHVPIAGSLASLLFISILFIFVSLSIGLLVSSLVNTQLVALLASVMLLLMPVILLSGMMFPVENMPFPLQIVSQIIPAKWYIIAVKKIMIKGLGFASIIKETSILIAMASVLITLSLKNFKSHLD